MRRAAAGPGGRGPLPNGDMGVPATSGGGMPAFLTAPPGGGRPSAFLDAPPTGGRPFVFLDTQRGGGRPPGPHRSPGFPLLAGRPSWLAWTAAWLAWPAA